MKEKKERVIDAVAATKAAIEEGILPGGGVALLAARKVLDKVTALNEDEKIGIEIVKDALEQPTRWLAKNSGEDDGYVYGRYGNPTVTMFEERLALLEGLPTLDLWPYVWPTLLMGLVAIPVGLWVFGLAERYAKRTGKLHRNG